ncbi:thiamine pyrophosphate-binding protein [Streptomyces sp. HNM0575]|uniref:thiamine pyrophosphate-dependent enzyme n=1 Tax=Streptomyces sp. HNM0575 TaxID=2716338 RepID=UPI00145F2F20|nr:thiamine pyrophosphate-dependent enzyme [Streptomyces sp. HNM0575]NLU74376.1 thiamine pyrophosphate-binding protein [Streptomyces sp. HNM0575]
MHPRLGGHALVEQMLQHGVELAFCVPGESYLAVLDGLYDVRDRVRLVTTRHEGGAAMMAAAHGRLTGRPGVALVTRGPGATNASIGVHIAAQDASPMVLFVGHVATGELGRGTFQEVDHRAMFAPLAKAVLQADSADRIPEVVARAFNTAVSGQPGPVVVALPEDVLLRTTDAPAVPAALPAATEPGRAEVEAVLAELSAAERPVIVAGGSCWDEGATDALRGFAEARGLPLVTAVRQQDLVRNDSPAYVGTLGLGTTAGLADLLRDADVVVLLGSRPDGLTAAEGGWLRAPLPLQRLVHIHPDPSVPNSVFRASRAVIARPDSFVAALAGASPEAPAEDRGASAYAVKCAAPAAGGWVSRLRENYLRARDDSTCCGGAEYMRELNARVSKDAFMTAGAGSYTAWHQRHRSYVSYPSQVATQAGAMGYGIPAAITAKLLHPGRQAVAFAGDGCFSMTGQELATAVDCAADILVIVVNNGRLGTIRDHQERRFPGRVSGTALRNPDFPALARAYGAYGRRAGTPESFGEALEEALDHEGPALVEVLVP